MIVVDLTADLSGCAEMLQAYDVKLRLESSTGMAVKRSVSVLLIQPD